MTKTYIEVGHTKPTAFFEYDCINKPTLDMVLQRVHPEDRSLAQEVIERASKTGTDFEHEYRLLMPSWAIIVAHATAQNTGIEVQNLQVQTSVLETVTVLAKVVSDNQTADLNLQAKKALTYETEQVLPGGYGSAFMNHP